MKHIIKPVIVILLSLMVVSYLVSGVYLNSRLENEINDLEEESRIYQTKRIELAEQKKLLEQKRKTLENELELQMALADERKIQRDLEKMNPADQTSYLQELKALEEAESLRIKNLPEKKVTIKDTIPVTSAS